jgi:hypothetical protein
MRPQLLESEKVNCEPGRLAPGVSRAPGSAPGARRPGSQLALALASIGVIWLLILPSLAEVSAIRSMIDRHEAQGVDPSAKFYSELPAMPEIIRQIDEIKWRGE